MQVLLVEDDNGAREMLADALRFAGYEVKALSDGLAALRVLEECTPDVVVVDLSLPMVSGFELLHEVRAAAATCDVPVIAISGHDDGIRLARETPEFFAVLQKPFDPDALLRAVARAGRHRGLAT